MHESSFDKLAAFRRESLETRRNEPVLILDLGSQDSFPRSRGLQEITASDKAARLQLSEKFFFWLDEPNEWKRKLRRRRLSGWCVPKEGEPLTAIRALLHGKIFPGKFDRERPELAPYLGLASATRWCGFTLDLCIPFGHSRLEVQVARAGGPWQKVYARTVRTSRSLRFASLQRRRVVERSIVETHFKKKSARK